MKYVTYVNCIICKRETPRQHSNYLFSDGAKEIRVCYRCDTA